MPVQETSGTQSADAPKAAPAPPRPLLVYDGDCGFCAYWARYWQKLTGDRVEYRPYQEVASQYPAISQADFQRAVQFIAPDGRRRRRRGQFPDPRHARGKGFWLALYRGLPGFAPVSELTYAFIAKRRPAFFRMSLLLWGRNHEPPRYDLVSFLFLRLFGLITLSAFVSFAVQAQGLIGSRGSCRSPKWSTTWPAVSGRSASSSCQWSSGSTTATPPFRPYVGRGPGLAHVVFNLFPRVTLFLVYALYLSLFYAGQTFMSFQWDTFLLETGFVALLMSLATTPGIWLARWLLFRFMFMSGVVKLLSGDPNWWNLSALNYHFLTQPLPTPLAWYAAQLPPGLLKVATGGMFVVELVLPFLIFCPRRLRFFSAFGILLLQSSILITGNYNWFNLQTMLLCLPLFDDAGLRKILPGRLIALAQSRAGNETPRRAATVLVSAFAALIVFCGLVKMDERFGCSPPSAPRLGTGREPPMRWCTVTEPRAPTSSRRRRGNIFRSAASAGMVFPSAALQHEPDL